MSKPTLGTNERWSGDKIRTFVVVNGKIPPGGGRSFDANTPAHVRKRWQEDKKYELSHGIAGAATNGHASAATKDEPGFRADVERYIRTVGANANRSFIARRWADEFGDRPRTEITHLDIREAFTRLRSLQTFRGHARTPNKGLGLMPATLNHYRNVLAHIWTILDGDGAPNPAKTIKHFRVVKVIRFHELRDWYRVLARMERDGKTRARLRVMLWTALPMKQLQALTIGDIDLDNARIRVADRHKGKGGHRGGWIPVLPPAVAALRNFIRVNAFGWFGYNGPHDSLTRAIAKENAWRLAHGKPTIRHMRAYDARHTGGTMMALLTEDERALQELMLHSTPQMTRHYTEQATRIRMQKAVAKMSLDVDTLWKVKL